MKQTRLVLVGGFLGSGKTTLLWAAARELASRGLRVGLVTNDQAPELVDTAFLARDGVQVAEVAGSCFCCNFEGLIEAITSLRRDAEADVLIAEPVGSCTDLSATLLQPLKEHFSRELVTAPLSVLVDPARLRDMTAGRAADLHASALYIVNKQLEEADLILISKSDLFEQGDLQELKSTASAQFQQADLMTVSAKSGVGLDGWLEQVMTRRDSGKTIATVDYDVYAEGEAVLGWLNATLTLKAKEPDWNCFAHRLIEGLEQRFADMRAAIGHVKLMLVTDENFLMANLTGGEQSGERVRGAVDPASEAQLILNARVQMAPDQLEAQVRELLDTLCDSSITAIPMAWQCLSPGRPQPTHRYTNVVEG